MRLTLLGSMQAEDFGGKNILPRSRKTRAALAILALANGAPVSRPELMSLLWSNRAPDQARGSLRQTVHELQELLQPTVGNVLLAERAHLSLDMDRVIVDAQCFITLPSRPEQALSLLDSGALTEIGRAFLEDLVGLDDAFARWLAERRRQLTNNAILIADAALAVAQAEMPAESAAAATAQAAARVLRLAPTREATWQALIAANIARGDLDGASRAFERCATALVRAGIGPPSPETRALALSIRATRPVRVPHAPAAEATPVSPTPVSPTPVSDTPGEVAGRKIESDSVRLGVMSFRPLGGPGLHGGDAALCAGIAEEITTALGRFRGIRIIAGSALSAPDAVGCADEPTQLAGRTERAGDWGGARDLRLDFMLDGTVQRSGDRIRVTARLLDIRSSEPGGELVWSNRFDGLASDLLALQEEIAAETVAQVDPELMSRAAYPHRTFVPALPLATPSAHELLLRAIPALYRMEEQGFRLAGESLAQAIAQNPGYASAHAWYAYWHLFLVGQGWASDVNAAMDRAGELADRAVSLDPTDARGLAIAGHARAFLRRNIDEALVLHERATRLNPNLPLAWVLSGLGLTYAGRHGEAVRHIEFGRKLSPFDPHSFFFDMALSMPLMLLGRLQESLAASRRAAALNPSLSSSYKGYLAALGLLAASDPDSMQADMALVRSHLARLEPDFTVSAARARSPLTRKADLSIYLKGLRLGGLREA